MKKIIVISFLVFLTNIFAQSPVGKGTYSVSGGISYSTTSEENSSNNRTYFYLNPIGGYFFWDNIFTGISLSYVYSSYGDQSDDNYGFGPTFRYYFDANENLKPFGGVTYFHDFLGENSSTSNFTITGGVDLFITNYFAIEGAINYSIQNFNYSSGYYSSDQTSKTFNISIGANYFIH
ncbi:MAG: hypothetical protein H6613_18590 [Ignavibacteriales bacterium]|nr:hypothetical protein [Ignavibacteriota bacterium]MCB9250410.1 hypothetical protein [Ignavibacteriales bacterium]